MAELTQSKGERTRQAIMDAAREIILEQGYTAASMRKIAATAGITPAAIYNHFPGKEALFSAILEEAVPFGEMSRFLGEVRATSAEELLSAAFRGIVAIIEAHEDYVRLALIDAQERDGATLVTFVPRLFPLLAQFTQQLLDLDAPNGRLRPISPPIIARAMISLIFGYLLTERFGRPEQTLKLPPLDWESSLLDVLMYGLFID